MRFGSLIELKMFRGGRGSYGSHNGRGYNNGGRNFSGRNNQGAGRGSSNGGRILHDVVNTASVLNFSVGQKASPAIVARWLLQMRDVIGEKCSKTGMKNIIKEDGTVGSYEEFQDPDEPADVDDVIEMTKWKTKFSISERKKEEYENDKVVAANAVTMYIGLQSRARLFEANETLPEDDRWNLNDVKDLLIMIMNTHFSDLRSDGHMISEDAQRNFVNIHMYPEEDLLAYNYRWRVLQNAFTRAMVANGLDNDDVATRLGSTEELVKRYIKGLDDARYNSHKEKYLCCDREWPPTLEEAYKETNLFTSSKGFQNKRGIFVISNSRNSNNNNSTNNSNKCTRCGATGHATSVCKNVLPSRGGRGSDEGRGRGRGRTSDNQAGGGPNPKS